MKVYWGTRRTAPLILNLETMRTWIINFKPQPLNTRETGWTPEPKKNIVPMSRIEPQILQPAAQELHQLSIKSSQIYCNTPLSHLGFPDNVLLQLFLFHLGTQFYSCLYYMSCLCYVCFCHVIISSLFYVAYPYTKESQYLLRTSCFNMDAKPTLNCPLAFQRQDIWLQRTRGRRAFRLATSGLTVTLQ
jgi:hypothetical protein